MCCVEDVEGGVHLNGHIAAPLSSYNSWSTPSPVALPDAVGYKVGPYLNGVKAPTSRVLIPVTH